MSLQAGLAFEQAPPFSLPLRFFLTAPLFLLAAAALIVWAPETLASRSTPQALALTHAITLGFLAMVMLGALTQMLPVVAGSPLPAPRFVTGFSHVLLTLGTVAMMTGFLAAEPAAFGAAIALLGGGFTLFLAAAAISLARAVASVTVSSLRLALLCLGLTLLIGLVLAQLRTGWGVPLSVVVTAAAHAAFGLLGWILLLVIGVAYQVVPMFQITPPYPLLLGVLFIGGFAVSVVSGMLCKIVPFLAWFHLQAQLQAHAGSIPTMKEMIAERWKRGQFRMHVFACVLLVAAVLNPPAFALPAGITLGLSALFLWVNLLSAVRRFTSQGGNLT